VEGGGKASDYDRGEQVDGREVHRHREAPDTRAKAPLLAIVVASEPAVQPPTIVKAVAVISPVLVRLKN
jgi:hypothetical protein